MQAPDEFAHFFRAEQLSAGEIIGVKQEINGRIVSGGYVDSNLFKVIGRFTYLVHDQSIKISDEVLQGAGTLSWTDSRILNLFPNTVVYPPFCYSSQVVGIWIGKFFNLSILDTYYLCRTLTALSCVLICFLALHWCHRGRIVMFTVLLFPMTLFLFSSCSQDALLISLIVLIIAIFSRLSEAKRQTTATEYLLILIGMAAVLTTRPPYIGLIILFFWDSVKYQLQPVRRSIGTTGTRNIAVIFVLSTLVGWATLVSHLEVTMIPGASVSGQLTYLINNPTSIYYTAVNTISEHTISYVMGTIGVLGWLDTYFPMFYYITTVVIIFIALIAESITSNTLSSRARIIALLALLTCILGVFAALYLRWSPVGSEMVDGVQGRYFIPLIPLLTFLVPSVSERVATKIKITLIVVTLFPLMSTVLMNILIVERYYLSFHIPKYQSVIGDWDNDGFLEVGIKRGSQWFLDNGNGVWDECGTFPTHDVCIANYGSASDQPVAGDWNSDGFTEIGIARGTHWFLDNGNGIRDKCGAFPDHDVCINMGLRGFPINKSRAPFKAGKK
jgi:uncharacterized membrane protein